MKERLRVLVVDDDPAFCRSLQNILRARGYRAETETDPEAVPARLEPEDRLVVLLDLKLGGACGLDLLRQIRSRFPETPMVPVTGCREKVNATMARGLRGGACACLYKPLVPEELFGAFEKFNAGRWPRT